MFLHTQSCIKIRSGKYITVVNFDIRKWLFLMVPYIMAVTKFVQVKDIIGLTNGFHIGDDDKQLRTRHLRRNIIESI